jgi:hypothetical protein
VGLTFSKKDPVGNGWVYGTWTSDFQQIKQLILTPNYRFKKFKEIVKESTLNLWFLVGSLRKPASPLNFFQIPRT